MRWRYGVVRLGWCGILMQAEALVFCSCGMWGWGLMAVWNRGLVSPGFYLYSSIKMMHGPIKIRYIVNLQ